MHKSYEHYGYKNNFVYIILVTSMMLNVSTPWKIFPNASTSWWKSMNDSSTIIVSAWTEILNISSDIFSEFRTTAETVHSSSPATSVLQTSSELMNSSYFATYAFEANVSSSTTPGSTTEINSSTFLAEFMFPSTTEYSDFEHDGFLNKSSLQCFDCLGSAMTCGKQRSSSDSKRICRSNRGENTCMTVVNFDSDETMYQRGCANYICPSAAQQSFICKQSSYCYSCCMTTLCNTEMYTPRSCSYQISAAVEILCTILQVLLIVI